jgi:ABC-type glycerol-3-phosphate transport system permease component
MITVRPTGTPRALEQSRQMAAGLRPSDVVAYVLMVAMGLVFLLPIFWMLVTSLKGMGQLYNTPPLWFAPTLAWHNYRDIFSFVPFGQYFRNTAIIVVAAEIGGIASSALVAYSFAWLRWPGRSIFFVLLLVTMMLPYQVTLIPQFIIYKKLGWVNTFLPLTVPWFFGSAFYIFLLRQFILTLPKELSEAALIDGCTYFGIFWRIVLSQIKPALTAAAIFIFMDNWNDFIGPLIYLNDSSMYTLAVGLSYFQTQQLTTWTLLMAASLLVMIPPTVLFLVMQRYFIQGIAMTGLKG